MKWCIRLSNHLAPCLLLWTLSGSICAWAFSPPVPLTVSRHQNAKMSDGLFSVSFAGQEGSSSGATEENDSAIQWELFLRHHAKGSWKGVWTSYDYIGDVVDETVASVDLIPLSDDGEGGKTTRVDQTHSIVVGAAVSDCETCFDAMEVKTLPVTTWTPDTILSKRARFGAQGMVNGPTLLRSGAMATELVLSQGDGRVRVTFQHAPVWERGNTNGVGPPDGLKLFRAMISREALRDAPPTPQSEQANPPSAALGNPTFFQPVPPFFWHKKWAGTCWTWGPSTGNQGWALEELEEPDAWHGEAPVEVWNLRLPGGIFVQTPRVITDASVGLCRLAWLPHADETLLRLEAGVLALQPIVDFMEGQPKEAEEVVGFYPPSLASFRCDVLTKVGDLEGKPQFLRDEEEEEKGEGFTSADDDDDDEPTEPVASKNSNAEYDNDDDNDTPDANNVATTNQRPAASSTKATKVKAKFDDGDLEDARDALQL